jgi:pimeloyl-ACP methyl ester carboxylesterase
MVTAAVTDADLELPDGRTLHYYQAGPDDARTVVFWHHGTPNVGSPPEPLFDAAAEQGLRWVSYDRPGYGGSSPEPDQSVASAAGDVVAIADALGLERFAVLGHSGGGSRALACGALLPDRVIAVVSISSPAPHGAEGLDWFAGWSKSGTAEQQAAAAGRAALEDFVAHAEFDMDDFTPADQEALGGRWAWVGSVAGQAIDEGPAAMIDDLLAAARPWGFDPADLAVPVLIVHGDADRMVPSAHARWLAARCPAAELRVSPDDGHVSVLDQGPSALAWLGRTIAAGA